jgi:hypothetical protein
MIDQPYTDSDTFPILPLSLFCSRELISVGAIHNRVELAKRFIEYRLLTTNFWSGRLTPRRCNITLCVLRVRVSGVRDQDRAARSSNWKTAQSRHIRLTHFSNTAALIEPLHPFFVYATGKTYPSTHTCAVPTGPIKVLLTLLRPSASSQFSTLLRPRTPPR